MSEQIHKRGWQALRPSKAPHDVEGEKDMMQAYHSLFTGTSTGRVVLGDMVRRFRVEDTYAFDSPNCNEQAAFLAGSNRVIDSIVGILNEYEQGEQ